MYGIGSGLIAAVSSAILFVALTAVFSYAVNYDHGYAVWPRSGTRRTSARRGCRFYDYSDYWGDLRHCPGHHLDDRLRPSLCSEGTATPYIVSAHYGRAGPGPA